MKKIYLVLIIFALQLSLIPVVGQDVLEETGYRKPVVESLDLMVDGSITPVLVNITKDYDYISRVIWMLHFIDNEIDYNTFGLLGALTNGSELIYDGSSLNMPIKTLNDLSHMSYDLRIDSDDKNPKDNHVVGRLSFFKFVPPYGLKMKEGHTFQAKINDDLSAVGSVFILTVEGFKDINYEPDFERDWLEEVFKMDDIADFVIFPVVLPLTLIFTWEFPIVLLGLGIALIELIAVRGIWVKIRD